MNPFELSREVFDVFVKKAESLSVEAFTELKISKPTFFVLKKDGEGDYFLPKSKQQFEQVLDNMDEWLKHKCFIVVVVSEGLTVHSKTQLDPTLSEENIKKHVDSGKSLESLPGAIPALNIVIHSTIGRKVIQYKINEDKSLTKIADTNLSDDPRDSGFTRVM